MIKGSEGSRLTEHAKFEFLAATARAKPPEPDPRLAALLYWNQLPAHTRKTATSDWQNALRSGPMPYIGY